MAKKTFWKRNASKKMQREIADTAQQMGIDPKALNILYNTYFDCDDTLQGWVEKRDVKREDFEYAKAAGVMFDPLSYDHDQLIDWVLVARDALKPADVASAFIASLGSRRQDLRSALGSYAHVLHLSRHAFQKSKDGPGCAVCSARKSSTIDMSARNFRRIKWAGNVEQGSLEYVGSDLVLFARAAFEPPTPDDTDALRRMLQAIRALPPTAGLTEAGKSIGGFFASNKHERQVVLEILGYAGVLAPAGWMSFFQKWVTPAEMSVPLHAGRREWSFPVSGWKGSDGVNETAVRFWFPQTAAR